MSNPNENRYGNIILWAVAIVSGVVILGRETMVYIGNQKKVAEFKKAMMDIAHENEIKTGIKPEITILQSGHESNWGQSELTVKANNLFGFTGESWEKAGKPVLRLPTKEYINKQWVTVTRPFRAYASWRDSIADWANLLTHSNYKDALVAAQKGDVAAFAAAVQKGGYATDPAYATQLVKLYNSTKDVAAAV